MQIEKEFVKDEATNPIAILWFKCRCESSLDGFERFGKLPSHSVERCQNSHCNEGAYQAILHRCMTTSVSYNSFNIAHFIFLFTYLFVRKYNRYLFWFDLFVIVAM